MDTAILIVAASLNLTFVYLNFVDEAAIMEQYGNEVGLAALEWCEPRIQTIQLDNWGRVVHWCD